MTPDPRAALESIERKANTLDIDTPSVSVLTGRLIDIARTAHAALAALPEGWSLIGPEQQAALADGEALARLAACLRPRWTLEVQTSRPRRGHEAVAVMVNIWDGHDSRATKLGPTIAAAADAAREALK